MSDKPILDFLGDIEVMDHADLLRFSRRLIKVIASLTEAIESTINEKDAEKVISIFNSLLGIYD
jgi:hypothetical protein